MTDADMITRLAENTRRIVKLTADLTKALGEPNRWFIVDEIQELSDENERIRLDYALRLGHDN